MGVAHYIVLEKEIEGLDTSMDGKKLSNNIKALDALAGRIGVRPLSEFFSMDADSIADVLGDEMDDIKLPLMEQFAAQDGLNTIQALLAHPEAQPALDDLQNCVRILTIAAEHDVRWHFQIDI